METGKQMITGLMVKANKVRGHSFGSSLINLSYLNKKDKLLLLSTYLDSCNSSLPVLFFWLFFLSQSPKAFLESYEDMLLYTQREETWPITKMELEGRGVSNGVIHVMLSPLHVVFLHASQHYTLCILFTVVCQAVLHSQSLRRLNLWLNNFELFCAYSLV